MKSLAAFILLALTMIDPAFSEVVYDEQTDEFTGEDNSSVIIFDGDENRNLTIAWKCLSDRLNVILVHDFLRGDSDDDVAVQTKFDEQEPSGIKFYRLHSSNEGTLFDLSDVDTFTKKAIAANEFMVRVTDPADRKTITATYRTEGLKDELLKLLCYP